MTFVENEKPESLNTAFWLFPLYLLLLNLPIIPILWAGTHLSLNTSPDFYVLGMTLTLGSDWLTIFTFVGGLSAASAMMIVTSLALSYMCLNHLFLPASISATRPDTNLYSRILWSKRTIIAAIIAAGYAFYIVIQLNEGLASLGLISFVAVAQLLPGLIGLLFWTRATQAGFILGLLGGASVWFVLLILPLVVDSASISSVEGLINKLGFHNVDIWSMSTFCSLSLNGILFIFGSLVTRPSEEEIAAAQACVSDSLQPLQGNVIARSTEQLVTELEHLLGKEAAEQEVNRALVELSMDPEENRPAELRLLHSRLERNLSGLLGPTVARLILRGSLQLQSDSDRALTESLSLMEKRLESSRVELRGMTRELDDLRRYLSNVLQELPLGVCSIGANREILIWNSAMQKMTGIAEQNALGSALADLSAPWSSMLEKFSQSNEQILFKQNILLESRSASFNLRKSDISTVSGPLSGQVILLEDRTTVDMLESELAHSERLASIGRLAAGVAHEIGNPLTGIASLAQNLHYQERAADDKESVSGILEQVDRINGIVKSLLTFSHTDSVIGEHRECVSVSTCVDEAIRLVQLSHEAKQININASIPSNLCVLAHPQQMVQIFVNLLNNACDASTSQDNIDISAELINDNIHISIRDFGSGIAEENHTRIFEPFFTTKPVGQGTGLGLPLVYSLINDHQGKIQIESGVTPGTLFKIELPQFDPKLESLEQVNVQ